MEVPACRQIVRWTEEFPTSNFSVAVNISALQLRQDDFVRMILEVVENTGADPKRLKLELTESMLAENLEDAITKMLAGLMGVLAGAGGYCQLPAPTKPAQYHGWVLRPAARR